MKLDSATVLNETPDLTSFDALCVVNRRSVPVEVMFNAIVLKFMPGKKRYLPANVALSILPRSALQVSLASGLSHTHALGIEGMEAYPTTPLDGPLADHNPVEALDRTETEQLRHTEPKAMTADGVESLGIGRSGGDDGPVNGIPAVTGDVELKAQALRFTNSEIRRGPQNPPSDLHGGGSRAISKKSGG